MTLQPREKSAAGRMTEPRNAADVSLADYLIRRCRPDDIDGFYSLADLSGPGLTSLPADRPLLQKRLAAASIGDNDDYLLMLEHVPSKQIAGCCAIRGRSGLGAAHWNFAVSDHDDQGPIWREETSLTPTDAFKGKTELGSLFLHPNHRHPGVGRFLSLSRMMLIALKPSLFTDQIWSELRGVVSGSARCPFYDSVMGPLLGLSFKQADKKYALENQPGLTAYLPKHPVRLVDLPETAQDVVSKTHQAGVGARKLLEAAGFHFAGIVDLLDGGPMMVVHQKNLWLHQSFAAFCQDGGQAPNRMMIASFDENRGFSCYAVEKGGRFRANYGNSPLFSAAF